MYNRMQTKPVMVRDIQIGGNDNVIIQSMTTTKTHDVSATVAQIKQLEIAGCQIIRVACPNIEDATAIKAIKAQISIPIVADIHFDYRIALEAIASGVDKIRINPGNIGKKENLLAVVNACKANNIPIRIGVNAGSLEKHLLKKYGYPCAQAMIESAKYNIELLEQANFYNTIVSLKSSDIDMAIEAYKEFAKLYDYPLHIGITESGTKLSGSVKSAIGLTKILELGIGNTVRVSLSCDPLDEIVVAKAILKNNDLLEAPTLVSCPTCGRIEIDLFSVANEIENWLNQFKVKLKVSILGCAVNGPGEAAGSDIGLAGGKNEGIIYLDGKFYKKVAQSEMIDTLKQEIVKLIESKYGKEHVENVRW